MKNPTFLIVGTRLHETGIEGVIAPHLLNLGWKTYRIIADPTRPEDLARAVPELKERLGQVDLLVYALGHTHWSSSPQTLARNFMAEFRSCLLGLVNAVVELEPVLSEGARVAFLTGETWGSDDVYPAVLEMVPSTIKMINQTPTLENFRIVHFRLGRGSGGYPQVPRQVLAELTNLVAVSA